MAESAIRRTEKILAHLQGAGQVGVTASVTHGSCGCSSSQASSACCPTVKKDEMRVVVTGAAGQIGYALLPLIASGQMLGKHQPLRLHLLEVAPALKALQGVAMELQDGAYDLLRGVLCTSDAMEAFKDVDVAILVGSFPRKKGMERKDLLEKNAAIFREQGAALDKVAKKTVKVLVVGNPANTNCAIAAACAPSIPRQNFSALTRLDMNRARAMLASKVNSRVGQIVNAIIWRNHSSTQYPDVNHAFILQDNGARTKIRQKLDNAYLNGEFIEAVQKRGAAILDARGLSSAMSAANAVVDHVRDWILGSPKGEWVSMAVASDGSYNIPTGVIYSFPVTCTNGNWSIVQGLHIDDFSKGKMQATLTELLEERDIAFAFLGIAK